MIKNLAHCPFSDRGTIALDCHRSRIVFNPDHYKPLPCEHLAILNGGFSVDFRSRRASRSRRHHRSRSGFGSAA